MYAWSALGWNNDRTRGTSRYAGFQNRQRTAASSPATVPCEKSPRNSAEYSADEDLDTLIRAWPDLGEKVRSALLAIVKAVAE